MIAILMLLPSLNSCVNPWIYIYFNPNLVSSFVSLFTRRTSSNSNLHSIGGGGGAVAGGKNSNSGTTTAGITGKGGRVAGANTLQGHQRLTKMLTNDSAECSNSVDSRSMQGNNSRLDLLTAAKETQQFGKGGGGHTRSASNTFRPGSHQQIKSCGTGTEISLDCDTKKTTMTTVTTSTFTTNNTCNKLEPVSVSSTAFNDASGSNNQHEHSLSAYNNAVNHSHHLNQTNHLHVSSNMSSMSNLNEESGAETVATYESTVTLNTNSTVTTAGRGCNLLCQKPHPQGRLLKSKSVVASVHQVKVRKPRRRISIQLDKMWSKISAPNKRSSPANSSQIDLYQSKHSEQFIV